MKYGDEQWRALSLSGGPIPPNLRAQGWHFCPDFDEDLQQADLSGECEWCHDGSPLAGPMPETSG